MQVFRCPSGLHYCCNLKRYSHNFLKEHSPIVTTKHRHISCIFVLDSQHNSKSELLGFMLASARISLGANYALQQACSEDKT